MEFRGRCIFILNLRIHIFLNFPPQTTYHDEFFQDLP